MLHLSSLDFSGLFDRILRLQLVVLHRSSSVKLRPFGTKWAEDYFGLKWAPDYTLNYLKQFSRQQGTSFAKFLEKCFWWIFFSICCYQIDSGFIQQATQNKICFLCGNEFLQRDCMLVYSRASDSCTSDASMSSFQMNLNLSRNNFLLEKDD